MCCIFSCCRKSFQSTPSAWRETMLLPIFGGAENISIHSLRMEGDQQTFRLLQRVGFQSTPSAWRETSPCCKSDLCPCYFNPLPPHGGRLGKNHNNFLTVKFQSTPSAWRETAPSLTTQPGGKNFNPLPPHGGRREYVHTTTLPLHFNPLPPHGGRRAVPPY